VPAVFVSPRLRERQLREALQEALQQQDAQALRQLSDRLVHRHGPVQLQRWMQALASEPQQLFWHQALAQPPKPEPQPSSVTLEEPPLEEPPVVEELPPVEQTITAEESAPPVEETLVEQPPAPAPAPIKTALQGWLPQWDGPQTDRLAS
jgi:hypothetical protein